MGLTDNRQRAKKITDYRQNAKKITDYRLENINRLATWKDIIYILFYRKRSVLYFSYVSGK